MTSIAQYGSLGSPAAIEVLLWYHCRPEPLDGSPVNTEVTKMLLARECIAEDSTSRSGFRTTAKGRAMVDMLCKTPFPEATFRDPRFQQSE